MQYRTYIIAVISASAVVGATTHADQRLSERPELPEGFQVKPMTWTGLVERGGVEISLDGTIEEVTQHIRAVKKDFTWASLRRDLGVTDTPLRELDTKTNLICDVGGENSLGPLTPNVEASRDKIADMTGACVVEAGPRVCSMITCTYNAAVWLCNDNATPITPACDSLASYVSDIIEACGQDYYHGHRLCRGQEFNSDNFNVIVGWKDHC
ncbi:hypothetical protein NUW58_g9005 [Xylaria curta]|uniref:Uncharacterized protein n=1 Tax=Xylaria curta TaxID=42375 RepID=A0ACC1N1M2_9PEZI|nr:hypothetical protein NUW58_g9005 [Xylaria curta]